MFRSKSLAGTVERPAVMGSVGTDDKFVMMDRVEDQLWGLWIRVQWGMAYGMGQWMARCQVVECESSCWSLQCSAVFLLVFVSV